MGGTAWTGVVCAVSLALYSKPLLTLPCSVALHLRAPGLRLRALAIEVCHALPLWWNDVDLGIVDHPLRRPRLTVVPIGDVEKKLLNVTHR